MSKRSNKNFTPDPLEMLAVYQPGPNGHSTRCIGFLMSRGKAGVEVFDADDRSLGIFANQKLGADALMRKGEGQ